MFDKLAFYIGWRYARSQSKNKFIQFISASSVIGIALGTCVLIWVLSAMNGFQQQLKDRLLSLVPHIEFIAVEQKGIDDWQSIEKRLTQNGSALGVAPFVTFGGLIQQGDKLKPIEIRGIDWQQEQDVSNLASYVKADVIEKFNQQDGVILGQAIIEDLGLTINEQVDVLVPQMSETGRLIPPKLIRLTLLGGFSSGSQLDHAIGYTQLERAAEATGWDQGVQGIRLKIDDVFNARQIAQKIGYELPYYVYIQDWSRQFGHVYNDIQLVRSVMYVILALVVAVACFNIVSTLVMAVNEKQSDIAILKTLGMPASSIIKIFMIKGLYSGLLGTLIGTFFGILGGLWLTEFFSAIESLIGIQFLSGDIYFIDFLPTELMWQDVVLTASVAVLMSIIATLYPAYKATKVEPAKVVGKV
ncbi:lipoprotein-releasing ABC transporter permease subunit LolE [Catenovulum maritimum]|uniref:ABC3 transporter permease C-terminal domain-containing protein n=1 Tax=Catenovulum maritimum TaxID=1513271 RepID=A0A0J8JKX0_9ALTE|nr:lipoprotein-releasing ABC transporter permease subunit LolE [Catenovulum maritimum]KMT65176.1 hypothetical protein XM47_10600 [Catenovulum maritimum]